MLLGVRKSFKKCMKRNGSQPLNLIRKSNNIAEMLRKDCSFSWTIKVKCLFLIVSAPFNFWLRSLKAYWNKFRSLFSEQQNLSMLEHFNLFFSSKLCRKIKNWCNHWISSWILFEHVDLFCLGNCTHPGYQPQTYRHGVSSVSGNISGWPLEQNDSNMWK